MQIFHIYYHNILIKSNERSNHYKPQERHNLIKSYLSSVTVSRISVNTHTSDV